MDYISDVLKSIKFNFKNIYGVPRGGLIPAVMLSHSLKLPLVYLKKDISDKTIIIDDIADTGKTLQKLRKKNGIVVTLFESEKSVVIPYVSCHIAQKNKWIVFPWEQPNSQTKRDNTI
jgi:uncharacterized protein